MVMIVWDAESERLFEAGLDRGVLYPKKLQATGYDNGVGWNGMTKVDESPEGGETTTKYANNGAYLNLVSREKFKGSISAFTYPKEWRQCDGSDNVSVTKSGGTTEKVPGLLVTSQVRRGFGLSYRTLVGNDTEQTDYGYLLHLVYNATAGVSSKSRETINENLDATEFSWNFDTTPVDVPGMKPTAHLIISSREADKVRLAKLEAILYGTETKEPRLPDPAEVIAILGGTAG